MAASLAARAMLYGDGVTNAGQDLRLGTSGHTTSVGTAGASALASRGGVRLTGTGTPLAVTPGSGMAVAVAVGQCFVPAASGDSGGLYLLTLDTAGSLTIAAADPTNPRIDLVVAQITDVGSSSSTATVVPVQGTPAPSPSAPALPAGALLLATVTVPAGATSISSGNIADGRQYTAALGGITPVANSSAYPANGAPSDYVHDLSTGRLLRWNGSAVTAPSVAPFAPVYSAVTANVDVVTSATITSATVTVDGSTTVEVYATIPGMNMATVVAGARLDLYIYRDGVQIDQWSLIQSGTVASVNDKGHTHLTVDVNPSAAAHTYSWKATATSNSGHQIIIYASSTQPASLYVRPAPR